MFHAQYTCGPFVRIEQRMHCKFLVSLEFNMLGSKTKGLIMLSDAVLLSLLFSIFHLRGPIADQGSPQRFVLSRYQTYTEDKPPGPVQTFKSIQWPWLEISTKRSGQRTKTTLKLSPHT